MEKDQAEKFILDLLRLTMAKNASDLLITSGFPPAMKIDGKVTPVSNQVLSSLQTQAIARAMLTEQQLADFEVSQECNFVVSRTGLSRFRVNAFIQRGAVALVFRMIATSIPDFESLGLPAVVKDIALAKRGLIFFVGGSGSGKSSSLAAMVGYLNANSSGHILSIEDPIEFLHAHQQCIVSQREVGVDSHDWPSALNNALRQAPDVVVIGAIRDRLSMEHALAFAETGHLCIASLHANSTHQAIDRIVNFFPEERRNQVLMDLSLHTKAIVAQRLIPLSQGRGRVAAVEVMLNSPLIADLIAKGDVQAIRDCMAKAKDFGMQTLDQALFDLYTDGLITYEDALLNADSENDLRLKIKLAFDAAKAQMPAADLAQINVV